MKNKYMIFMLIGALVIGSLTGCQTRSDQQSAGEIITGDDPENIPEEESDSTGNMLSGDTAPDSSDPEVPMTEQTVLEYEGVTVKAISWDSDKASLKIQAQNSSDRDYIIQFSNTSINNYMMEPIFSMNINANSQAEKNAEFNPSDLSECGIENVALIQMRVNLLDAISFDTLYSTDYITVQTGASMDDKTNDESGNLLYDQDGLKLISRGFVDDPEWGKLWKVYISNDTGKDLVIYAPTVTLNGNTLDVLFSVTVPAGKRAIGTMTIFQEDIDTYQINNIESATVTLQLQNPETFETLRTIDDVPLDISSR